MSTFSTSSTGGLTLGGSSTAINTSIGLGGLLFNGSISPDPQIYFIEGFERYGLATSNIKTYLMRTFRGFSDGNVTAVAGRFSSLAAQIDSYVEIDLTQIPNTDNLNKICVGFAMYVDGTNTTTADGAFLRLLDTSGNAFLSLSSTKQNLSTVNLYKYIASTINWDDGLDVITNLRPDKWNYFEILLKVHSTLGTLKIKCNNQIIYDFSGDTTTSSAGNDTITYIQFGVNAQIGFAFPSTTGEGVSSRKIDDLYIADDFVDDAYISSIKYLIPIQDGTYSEWGTPSAGPGEHYTTVDESPCDDEVSFITNFSYDRKESFILSNLGTGLNEIEGKIHCISLDNCALDSGTIASGNLNNLIITDTYDYTQGYFDPVDGAWLNYIDIAQINPDTRLLWTIEEINNIETGVKYVFS